MLQLMFHEYAGKVAEINDAGLINVLNYILIKNIKFKLKLKLFFFKSGLSIHHHPKFLCGKLLFGL